MKKGLGFGRGLFHLNMKKTALLLVSSQIVLIAATLAVATMLGHANAYAAVFWLASLLVFLFCFPFLRNKPDDFADSE